MIATAAILTFVWRDLIQAIWLVLLSPDFIDAYQHGIVILCGDGITRHVFPQFFVYSCDYPEK